MLYGYNETLFGKELRYVNGNLIKENTTNVLDQYFTKTELAKTLLTDWTKYASLATNSCYHIGKSNIFLVLKDNSFIFMK
ncbi:MAG: hypothetical protein LBR17_04535 [Bacteroidales bacterium]|jgi:hypothetical protein|nr:hypothetical protein [Bacteroidales bacterium]